MKKENFNRVKELVKAIDELELIINSFESDTDKLPLLYCSLVINGRGNTAGNTAERRFNGVVSTLLTDYPEYNELKEELTDSITELYLHRIIALKKRLEKELEFL